MVVESKWVNSRCAEFHAYLGALREDLETRMWAVKVASRALMVYALKQVGYTDVYY